MVRSVKRSLGPDDRATPAYSKQDGRGLRAHALLEEQP